MSVQAMAWVIEHAEVGGTDLLVMLMVANHAHSDGTNAFQARDTLARECRMSERQVRRILQGLVTDGHLEVTGLSKSGTKVYRIPGMAGGDKLTPQGGTNRTEGGTSTVKGGTYRVIGGDVAVSPEPSVTVNEPSRTIRAHARAGAVNVPLLRARHNGGLHADAPDPSCPSCHSRVYVS